MPLVPSYIHSLSNYIPGKPIEEVKREFGIVNAVKLASNENPLGPSKYALDALKNNTDIHRYPDSSSYELRKKLSLKFNLDIFRSS